MPYETPSTPEGISFQQKYQEEFKGEERLIIENTFFNQSSRAPLEHFFKIIKDEQEAAVAIGRLRGYLNMLNKRTTAVPFKLEIAEEKKAVGAHFDKIEELADAAD